MANGTEQMEWNIGKNDEIAQLRAAQHGDGHALEFLLREHSRMVRAVAHMYSLQGADLEDLIQEGMIALLVAIEHFDFERNVAFAGYARLCVQRKMCSFLRSANARKHEPLSHAISLDKPPFEDLEHYLCPDDNPETLLIGQEEHKETLSRLFSLLSHFEAQVLQLYLYGLSYDEIAFQMGKNPKSVQNAMQRIHRKAEHL